MITRTNKIKIEQINKDAVLKIGEQGDLYKEAIFFDLEHYVYKKPICIGVFGCCHYNEKESMLEVTQYMMENRDEVKVILEYAKKHFEKTALDQKKYVVTFSGNNDFTMINYLFNKYKIEYPISEYFCEIDLQKEYEKIIGKCIGLKALEKLFGITRESESISGSNLAKTFSKVMKDPNYFNRMPPEKKERILLYNEQDVVSLFHIYINWETFVKKVEVEEEWINSETE